MLTVSNISKNYADRLLFDNASFFVGNNTKLAIIGDNGTGKSTILKMIIGEVSYDTGNIILDTGKTIGYLPQDALFDSELNLIHASICINDQIKETLTELNRLEQLFKINPNDNNIATKYAEANAHFEHFGGYALLDRSSVILKILGFKEDEFLLSTDFLSGGQKTRALLAKLLLSDYDLLLLDEPTNHLDYEAQEKFVDYLNRDFKGSAVIVSHDRYFLDQITNKIIEIENKGITEYIGNYSDYVRIKKERLATLEREIEKQKKEISHMEEAIQTLFSHRKFSARDSLVKKLNKVKLIAETQDKQKMSIKLSSDSQSGSNVLKFEDMHKSFDNKVLFNNVSLTISRGEKIGIVGPNGSGKSTFIKIINGTQTANSGTLTYGHNVKLAYFAQEFDHLSPEKTLFDELLDNTNISSKEARELLAKFLFTGDMVFKLVENLSGGEKCRLSLAKIMAEKPNLLLLDEPTNHLDITSCEILENALNSYDGTIIVVSHDRYFLDKTVNLIIEIKDGNFTKYFGNYSYYKEKSEEVIKSIVETKKTDNQTTDLKKNYSNKDIRLKLKPLNAEIKKIEVDIEATESRLSELSSLLGDEEIYKSGQAKEITKEYSILENKLKDLLSAWEDLQSQIDELNSIIV